MKRVTQGGDISFNVADVRGLGDNYAFRFYTTDSCKYIVKVDGDAVDGIIRLEWDELKTLGDGVLNYSADSLEPDEEYSDATFNRTFGGTTQWYIVTSCSGGGGGGSSEEISELSDRLDAEISRSTEKDEELEAAIDNTYTKAEVDQKIAEAEMGGDIPSGIVIDPNYVHTDNNYTTADRSKLDGIAAGAEVNVQADWNVTDSSSDAYIKNKPDFVDLSNRVTSTEDSIDRIINQYIEGLTDDVSDLQNGTYRKNETYSQSEIDALIEDIGGGSAADVEFKLFDATVPQGTSTQVEIGSSYSVVVSPNSNYTITSANGTMDGGTLTKSEQDGSVTFETDNVSGNITITVSAVPTDLADKKLSVMMSKSYMTLNPNLRYGTNFSEKRWTYQSGLVALGVLSTYDAYKGGSEDVNSLLTYVLNYYHGIINSSGINDTIAPYKKSDYNSDNVQAGYNLFRLYELDTNQDYKGYYVNVINTLVDQIKDQPRLTTVGIERVLQHKAVYASQHWLDGQFMTQPFRALHAKLMMEGDAQLIRYNNIVGMLIKAYQLTYDFSTGLCRHAYSEDSSVSWVDHNSINNGQSYFTWGRALGWYIMAIVDVLDFIPEDIARRNELIDILYDQLMQLQNYKFDGVWMNLPTEGELGDNYKEATSSCMFAYGYLHGVRMGYLPESMKQIAKEAYENVVENFIKINGTSVTLENCASGGNPGGTSTTRAQVLTNYYSRAKAENDWHGVGPFIRASLEYELLFGNVD